MKEQTILIHRDGEPRRLRREGPAKAGLFRFRALVPKIRIISAGPI